MRRWLLMPIRTGVAFVVSIVPVIAWLLMPDAGKIDEALKALWYRWVWQFKNPTY
jgi:hypothetical protein